MIWKVGQEYEIWKDLRDGSRVGDDLGEFIKYFIFCVFDLVNLE